MPSDGHKLTHYNPVMELMCKEVQIDPVVHV